MDAPLTFLQKWFVDQCDGDWEHSWGVKIYTLDNPGWAVRVVLTETSLADLSFDDVLVERSEDDWLDVRVRNSTFEAFCGPVNLAEVLARFRALVEAGEP